MKFYIKYPARTANKIVKAWQEVAKDIYDQSQVNVPVKTGHLKGTGTYTKVQDGAIIKYTAKYASIQEIGRAAGQRTRVPASMIQPHSRGTKSGGTTKVKKYYRRAFTTTSSTAIKGKFYLTKAYEMYRPQINMVLSKYLKVK